MLIFLLVYVGFALAFLSTFGGELPQYRDLITSAVSMFRALLGQFHYEEGPHYFDYWDMEKANPLAPLLFFLFTVFTVLMLVNMFISILDSAYVQANNEAQGRSFDFLNSALKLIWREWKNKFCCTSDDVLVKYVGGCRQLQTATPPGGMPTPRTCA